MSFLMQARSSSTGEMVTWVTAAPDFAGGDFPGPGTAEETAVAAFTDAAGLTSVSMAGNVTGSSAASVVEKINGTSVPATPSAGQVLTATSPTEATWQTPSVGAFLGSTSVQTFAETYTMAVAGPQIVRCGDMSMVVVLPPAAPVGFAALIIDDFQDATANPIAVNVSPGSDVIRSSTTGSESRTWLRQPFAMAEFAR